MGDATSARHWYGTQAVSASDTIVATLRRNAREEVRVGVGTFNSYALVSLRVWADSDKTEQRIPTKAGFNFALDRIDELIAALSDAREAGIKHGLCKAPKEEAA